MRVPNDELVHEQRVDDVIGRPRLEIQTNPAMDHLCLNFFLEEKEKENEKEEEKEKDRHSHNKETKSEAAARIVLQYRSDEWLPDRVQVSYQNNNNNNNNNNISSFLPFAEEEEKEKEKENEKEEEKEKEVVISTFVTQELQVAVRQFIMTTRRWRWSP
jgi:hypothetical protein